MFSIISDFLEDELFVHFITIQLQKAGNFLERVRVLKYFDSIKKKEKRSLFFNRILLKAIYPQIKFDDYGDNPFSEFKSAIKRIEETTESKNIIITTRSYRCKMLLERFLSGIPDVTFRIETQKTTTRSYVQISDRYSARVSFYTNYFYISF
jgi:hypothetical protein